MSNIRIEMDDPAPLPRPAPEMGPGDVAAMLGDAGLFDTHPRVAFLSGYTGGQVNPVAGDFTFNCQALYEIGPEGAVLYRPSSFRGSILGALESIRSAFGPLQLDAIGTCGKWGQSVPSCGGSHAFVLLGADPRIGLGA
jgi:TldD protein